MIMDNGLCILEIIILISLTCRCFYVTVIDKAPNEPTVQEYLALTHTNTVLAALAVVAQVLAVDQGGGGGGSGSGSGNSNPKGAKNGKFF